MKLQFLEVTEATSTDNNLVPKDLANSVFLTLLASGKLDPDGMMSIATLMGKYIALRNTVPQNGTLSFEAKAHASAYGWCLDRISGWISGYVEVEEVYIGQNYQDVIDWILLQNKNLGPIVKNLQCDDNGCRME
eukprot:TRINITY_DN14999_c1_g1_i1.p4 TRINITY_DN14999_c1_g1~~TRINITY_DN14999_c1_g1_i1.p4  ORF type:complete len:134 (-),score=14.60 TRINITY_DN14999_c1_g1_i1:197-598(-)